MDTFAPEFSRFWLSVTERDGERRRDEREDDVRRQQKALEELVERVNAARSVV
jgi:hypothetical protein